MAGAVRAAVDDLAPGSVAVARGTVVGAASNRALPAWRHYTDAERSAFLTAGPGAAVAADAPLADRCCDPRVTVLLAERSDGGQRVALAWFAVHGTSLGPEWPTFSADLWGRARTVAENGRDRLFVGFGGGSSGDVSPLPLDDQGLIRADAVRPSRQGRELADAAGTAIGAAVGELIDNARPGPFTLGIAHERWRPRASGLPAARPGIATVGGGVDGPTERWAEVRAGVGAPLYQRRRWRSRFVARGQSPKIPVDAAYSPVPLPIGLALRFMAPSSLPLHVLRVGDHVFATVPGEPTTMAGWRIERAVAAASGTSSASVIGYAGDYGGYWTTPEEYDEQRYEAASTVFGREATTRLTERLAALAQHLA